MLFPKLILDGITEGQSLQYIMWYIIIYIGVIWGLDTLFNLMSYMTNILANKLELKTEEYFCEKTANLSYEYIESRTFLDMREMAEKYMYANERFGGVYFSFLRIFGCLMNFLLIIGIVSSLNVFIIAFLGVLIYINSLAKAKVDKNYFNYYKETTKINRELDYNRELIFDPSWLKEVKINNLQEKILNKIIVLEKYTLKQLSLSRLFSIKMSLVIAGTELIRDAFKYIYLGIQVFNNSISIGSFTLYVSAINSFSNSLTELIASVISVKNTDLYYEEFNKFIALKSDQKDKKPINLEEIKTIEFENVSFKYPNAEKYTLENISFKIEKGEKLLVVGENGAGKTTFIKLLLKLYEVTEGKILINGIDIKELDYENYMKNFSVVFQDFKIFSYSIKDNVTFFKNNIEDNRVLEVLDQSGFKIDNDKFKDGIYTNLFKEFDDTAIQLSGGEAQKLSIARALLKNGNLVILDEPTAALDPRSEYDIYMKFNDLVQDKTAIYISHRLSSAKICDKVMVFEKGKIAEYGTHGELLAQGGIYRELYTKQAQFYNENVALEVGALNV